MSKSRFRNPPWPRWVELPAAQGARRRRSRRSATPTTSNAARRSKSAQPSGLRRQATVPSVAPPRRIAVDTPSSSLLGSGGLALATRLTRGFGAGSKVAIRQVDSKTLYRGRVVRLTMDTFRTAHGRSFRRETFQHPASVVIVPLLEKDRVLLIRQFRHALERYIYEIPAGTSEPGEPLLSCAKRELAEETGYRAARWKRLCEFYPAPGVSTERMVLYRASHLSPLARKVAKDKDEYITPKIVSARTAVGMIRNNQVIDAKSIIGLLMGLERIRW